MGSGMDFLDQRCSDAIIEFERLELLPDFYYYCDGIERATTARGELSVLYVVIVSLFSCLPGVIVP